MPRGERIARLWDTIPEGTDIVLTHTPPFGILDYIPSTDERVGCEDLLNRILQVQPKIHAFGHIHESYGEFITAQTRFINASSCNEKYKIVNKPICLEL
jgi:Icc-related predicted phosphoesterase